MTEMRTGPQIREGRFPFFNSNRDAGQTVRNARLLVFWNFSLFGKAFGIVRSSF